MTVSTSKRVKRHVGNGVTTQFPYDFYIPNEASLEVYLYDSVTGVNQLLNPSVYSVTGIGDVNFGEVTYPLSGSPITSTQTLTIRRVVEYTQNTSIRNQTGFFPEVIEDALDHLTFQTQQNAEELSRAIVAPLEEETDMTLPSKAKRVSKVLAFDSDGQLVVLSQLDKSADTVTATGTDTPRSLAEWMRNVQVQFATASALEANSNDLPPVVMVRGYASDGDGGDGIYHLDASDNITPSRDWDVIGRWTLVDATGARWKLQNPAGRALSFQQVGIRPGSSSYATDNTAILQAFLDSPYAQRIYAGPGTYHFDGPMKSTRGNKEIAGAGKYFTTFDFGDAPDYTYLTFEGESFDKPLAGITLRDFKMVQTGRADGRILGAIRTRNVVHSYVKRVSVEGVRNMGWWAIDCDDIHAEDFRTETVDYAVFAAGVGARVLSWEGVSNSTATRCQGVNCSFGLLCAAPDWSKSVTITSVNTSTNTFTTTAASTPRADGESVQLKVSPGGAAPGGLEADGFYWAVTAGGEFIGLAASPDDAVEGKLIDLTSSGSGTLTLRYNDNNVSSIRPREDISGVVFSFCTITGHSSAGIDFNSTEACLAIGCTVSDVLAGNAAAYQNKHSSTGASRFNTFAFCVAIRCGTGFYSQRGSKVRVISCVVRDPLGNGFWSNSANNFVLSSCEVYGLASNRWAVRADNANRCVVDGIMSTIADGATGTGGILLSNADNAAVNNVKLLNTHATGIEILSTSANVTLGDAIDLNGSPLIDDSTSTKYPRVYQAVVNPAVVGNTPIGVVPRGALIGRVEAFWTVAASSGNPEMSVGIQGAVSQIVALETITNTAQSITHRFTVANNVVDPNSCLMTRVNTACTGGQLVISVHAIDRL